MCQVNAHSLSYILVLYFDTSLTEGLRPRFLPPIYNFHPVFNTVSGEVKWWEMWPG